ncbi:hypothetical protein ACFX1X_023802 [Malus domestica]
MATITTTSIQETQTHRRINPSVTFWQRLVTLARIRRESGECAVQGDVAACEEDKECGEVWFLVRIKKMSLEKKTR